MPKKVAFQGERGAYSERAALAYFGRDLELIAKPSFKSLFASVAEKEADAAVVPIENALAGSVHENYDWLLQYELPIVGEIVLHISHHLMALPGVKLHEIRRVISHPQALQQCRDFLENLENITIESSYDTAGSGKKLVDEKLRNAAAIASQQAAEEFGLDILVSEIESNHENYTRFLILERKPRTVKSGGKTSIVFSFEDSPGALFKSQLCLHCVDINLLKIESRPLHGKPFRYHFYLDIEGSLAEEPLRKAIDHLDEIATFIQVLGSYPKGEFVY